MTCPITARKGGAEIWWTTAPGRRRESSGGTKASCTVRGVPAACRGAIRSMGTLDQWTPAEVSASSIGSFMPVLPARMQGRHGPAGA